MIYGFLKVVVKITLRIFFKKIIIQKKHELPNRGPLIVVVNHPNTFMDPIIVASLFKQQVGFLGNASIFVNKIVNAIFAYFHVIRVYRQKDVPEGEKPDNDQSFRDSHQYLKKGGTILIFPEGNSYHELKLRKIKTGAARIALGAEQENDYNLNIMVQPVGLYYSNPQRFRSKLYINIGEAFPVKPYIESHKKEAFAGVQQLTDQIKKSLEENVITTVDTEQEELFVKIKRIYKKRLLDRFKQSDDAAEEFRLTREMAKAIHYFKVSDPEIYHRIKENVDRYIDILNRIDLKGNQVFDFYGSFKKLMYSLGGLVYAIGGLPIYLFGLLQNYIPYKVPYWIAKSITREIEYHAPIMMTIGIVIFPFFYFLYGLLIYQVLTQDPILVALYIVLLPLTGFYVLHYFNFIKVLGDFFKFNPLFRSADQLISELKMLRENITFDLDEARLTYIKRL